MNTVVGIVGLNALQQKAAFDRMAAALRDHASRDIEPFISPSGNAMLAGVSETSGNAHILALDGRVAMSNAVSSSLCDALTTQGTACLEFLNGFFSLAFWNEPTQTLVLARDKFGQRSLYYTQQKNLFIFASEIRTLLASGLVPRRLDPKGLEGFLAFGALQEPGTIIKEVSLLPKASFLTIQPGQTPDIYRYWQQPQDKQDVSDDHLQDNFISAVHRCFIADNKTGVFLSGGIDSSAVAVAAARHGASPFQTLSVIYPEHPASSEAAFAKIIADKIGSQHIEVPFSASDFARLYKQGLDAMDQPSCDGLNTFIAADAARQAGLDTALSGLGADELFGGYPVFRDLPQMLKWPRSLRFLAPGLAFALKTCKVNNVRFAKLPDILSAAGDLIALYFSRRRFFADWQISELLSEPTKKTLSETDSLRMAQYHTDLVGLLAGRSVHDAIGIMELETYMANTLLRDTETMGRANRVTVISPFLDTDFADSVLCLPTTARQPTKVPKHRFVQAMGDMLPCEIVNRQKMGFVLPMQAWLKSELKNEIEAYFQNMANEQDHPLNGQAILRLWHDFCRHPDKIRWSRPWGLFALAYYIEKHGLSL